MRIRRVISAEAPKALFPAGCEEWALIARIRPAGAMAQHKTEVPRQQWLTLFGKICSKRDVPTSRYATPSEVKRLKVLGAIRRCTSADRVVLVCVAAAGRKAIQKASEASGGGGARPNGGLGGAMEGILLAVARLQAWAPVPLPDHLPTSPASAGGSSESADITTDGGGDDCSNVEDDDDDSEGSGGGRSEEARRR